MTTGRLGATRNQVFVLTLEQSAEEIGEKFIFYVGIILFGMVNFNCSLFI